MQFHRTLQGLYLPASWLTIGSFDGLHRGHRSILGELVEGAHAAGVPAVAVIFDPHPVAVLRPEVPLQMLSSVEERAALFEEVGLDVLLAHPFNKDVAALTAEAFLRRLKSHLNFQRFFVGYDFAMGKDRSGDLPRLKQLSAVLGYELQVFQPLEVGGELVSSSRIRSAIAEGDVERAGRLLGRPYTLSGVVVPGSRRGSSIGIPTANIDVPPGRAVPGTGVYACRLTVAGETYAAATNIGVRPTFEPGSAPQIVEAHILDFNRDIYNEVVQLHFIQRLRGERKFSGVDALIAQIQADIRQTREVLDETLPRSDAPGP